jgi:hypothetical protein
LISSQQRRDYRQDVDWVFHEAKRVLSPREVEQRVATLRAAGVSFRDTVPPAQPALPSPCDF